MSTFVLVHGAWHGGWCWYKTVPLLEKRGHTVIAPDLPSHGRDKTPLSMVSLSSYVDSVCRIVDAHPEPIVLVGHSLGGGIITQTAEHRPEKIKVLVYIAALLPKNGEAMFDLVQQDTDSLVLPNMEVLADQAASIVREGALKDLFYADCTDEDLALAKSCLVPQPIAPGRTPLMTTELNFGRVPRMYIECLRDRAVTPSLQRKLYTSLPFWKVISMDTSHSPFFSASAELAAHLASL